MIDRADHRGDALSGVRSGPAGGTGSAFADVVCADPDFLRIEFDAIIAANYPTGAGNRAPRPPRRARPAATGYRALRLPTRRPARDPTSGTSPGAGRSHPRARQRGPPGRRHARRP